MADTRSPLQRSAIMRAVSTKNTGPEIVVRRMLHREGYRFGLHRRDLPGSPDIVLPKHSKIVFVHGCFWHGHKCRYGRPPKSRSEYWLPKLAANKKRDLRNRAALRRVGWSVLVVWQCETRDPESLRTKLLKFVRS
jgi:DNA mismatch endonuclease (patch repair protein)